MTNNFAKTSLARAPSPRQPNRTLRYHNKTPYHSNRSPPIPCPFLCAMCSNRGRTDFRRARCQCTARQTGTVLHTLVARARPFPLLRFQQPGGRGCVFGCSRVDGRWRCAEVACMSSYVPSTRVQFRSIRPWGVCVYARALF